MAKLFACTILLVILAYSSNTFASDIEGGVPTTIQAHPYLVSIQGKDGSPIICGGALINENTVVTAAQCLAFYDASQLAVGVNNGEKIVEIAAQSFNPRFDFVTMENDVAVLKLAESVESGSIELASELPANGAKGVVTGWAANNSLVDVAVRTIDAEECGSGDYKYSEDEVLNTMLCGLASNLQACNGQAGDPLVVDNQLVGLVSWGYGCGNKGNPAVFTNIAAERSWIIETANQL
ncbi:trypsin theta-like [Bactrocera tryoni]|uniref:trypsin theta-like n=1 Tax=Bactrocera tryoni TaxID=59916 RepID=UPI001A962E41|nr:trypsin theta-like [Bactrocera tryoni]